MGVVDEPVRQERVQQRLDRRVRRPGLEEVRAKLATRGAVKPTDATAPQIWLVGEAWWDLQAGRLIERRLKAELANVRGEPGSLELRVGLVD